MQVRGPRIRPLVVRVERRWQTGLAAAVVLGVILLSGLVGYFFGRDSVLDAFAGIARDSGIDPESNPRALVGALLSDNAAMRDELAVQRGSQDVSREVEEQVRQENRRLQDEIAALERAVAWYRKLSVTDRAGTGLRLDQVGVQAAPDNPSPVLRFLLVRTGETDGTFEGAVEGTVTLRGGGSTRQLPLQEVLPAEQRAFRVRYVEEKRLSLSVPAETTVERVELAAVVKTPQAARITRVWQRP